MYVDDPAGTDLTITVDGQDYQAEATEDTDGDGIDDTATQYHDDGSSTMFTDTDGDGQADLLHEVDESGGITTEATYDPARGAWVGSDGGHEPAVDEFAAADDGAPMTIETPDGEIQAGPPTHDTNDDGVNDTVTITGEHGETLIYTDSTGDNRADMLTQIDADGTVTVMEYQGDGNWVVVEEGQFEGDGEYQLKEPTQNDSDWG